MEWGAYVPVVIVATAVLASAVWALHWAVKNGQFRQVQKGATVIFDDEEPVGRPTDFFPGKAPTVAAPPAGAPKPTNNPR